MLKRLYIIENRPLGEAVLSRTFIKGELRAPDSLLFFCRVCGETFARLPVLEDGVVREWQSYKRICRKCGRTHKLWYGEVPGSISLSWDEEASEAFPVPVLQWEIERHLDKLENEDE